MVDEKIIIMDGQRKSSKYILHSNDLYTDVHIYEHFIDNLLDK